MMAANTKYQPAPQSDPFEEQDYTSAPPSYQAESSTAQPDVLGSPRGEDDNIPDDFKV
jgi:protein lifeguard